MKTYTLCVLLLFSTLLSFTANSQAWAKDIKYSTLPKPFEFSIIDSNQSSAYSHARLFIAEYYRSANDVLQMQDSAAGILVGKAIMKVMITGPGSFGSIVSYGTVDYQFKIQVKGNRYKLSLTNFYYNSTYADIPSSDFEKEYPEKTMPTKHKLWQKIKEYVANSSVEILNDFKTEMQKTDDF